MRTIISRRSCLPPMLLSSLVILLLASGGLATAETRGTSQFYLVGTGPGDPDLITLRGLSVIEKADVIVCTNAPETSKRNLDGYFAFEDKFASALAGKELIYVDWYLGRCDGQDPAEMTGEERRRREEILRKRCEFAAKVRQAIRDGKTIAVLSKGDPLIYGPHAWCLAEFADLRPVVVPGLSAFNAANAALGVNVTGGQRTSSVILTAGRDTPGSPDTLEKLSTHRCTMAIFTMGLTFKETISQLLTNYPGDTPVAIVKYAGYVKNEEVVEGTLATIVEKIGSDEPPFEYMIYVGDFLAARPK